VPHAAAHQWDGGDIDMGTYSATRLRTVLALTGSLALAATLLAATPASAASPTACRVKNLDTGVTKYSLQKAHDAAGPGHSLTVRGTCAGLTTISTSLTIIGSRTATSGMPALDAKLNGTVVMVQPGVKVTMKDLTIRNGAGSPGGILNHGRLFLRDVVVRANTGGGAGGGILNYGTLTLNGSTSIRGNTAGKYGGGVWNESGIVKMNGSSSIRGNTAGSNGGGVYNFRGTLTMNGTSSIRDDTATWGGGGLFNDGGSVTMNHSSSIRGNTSEYGAGVFNKGHFKMNGSSSIKHNSAAEQGGGIFMESGASNAVSVTCGPRGNVHDNSPDDCGP
jgi:hypothetical protein